MYSIDRTKKKTINFLYDHPGLKTTLSLSKCIILTIFSAFVFSFGYNTFISPNFNAIAELGININSIMIREFASCGASGISQSILLVLKFLKLKFLSETTISNVVYWIIYFLVNLPLLIFGFIKIGKRFSIFTLLNVVFTSFFGIVLKSNDSSFFINEVSSYVVSSPFLRLAFAGCTTGVASGLAYKIEASAGGADILSYYISEKKSMLVGRFSIAINVCISGLFCFLSLIKLDPMYGVIPPSIAHQILLWGITFIYMFFANFVVDKINTFNTKVLVQVITSEKNLSNAIIAAIPHSCTIEKGFGGYTNSEKLILYISVRKKELKTLKHVCQKEDKHVFINVIPLADVFGRFSRKPIK